MSSEEEASELRKRLTAAISANDILQRLVDQYQGTVMDCSACKGNHIASVAIQRLNAPHSHEGTRYGFACVCPATGKAVLISTEGQSRLTP